METCNKWPNMESVPIIVINIVWTGICAELVYKLFVTSNESWSTLHKRKTIANWTWHRTNIAWRSATTNRHAIWIQFVSAFSKRKICYTHERYLCTIDERRREDVDGSVKLLRRSRLLLLFFGCELFFTDSRKKLLQKLRRRVPLVSLSAPA